jgi:hypothetical protein
MGFDNTSLRIHCSLKKRGYSFEKVATLGRQTIYEINENSLKNAANSLGLEMPDEQATEILHGSDGYADGIYRWLGAKTIHSYDYSSYEGATHVWDMNEALPAEMAGGYDFVFDGGTLEHVFNYPSALRETMTLASVGGIFLSATPANSYFGHGFYQLGPDIPFSILNEKNGYETGEALLVEMRRKARFFEILPPSKERGRALASTIWPTLMYFWGTRKSDVPHRLQAFQPDYVEAWDSGEHSGDKTGGVKTVLRKILSGLPVGLKIDILGTIKFGYVIFSRNSLIDRGSFNERKDI